MAQADVIVEGEYRAGHQEQLYIEPNGVVAVPENGGVTLYGSLQCPYYVHRALTVLLGLPPQKVRVVQTETGGGFGGKEEYPSMIAGHAALVAMKSGRPAKLIYDRVEDMLATTKRHPAIVRHRTGVQEDGRLTAMEIDVVLDGGAYATLSAVVLSRGMIHASGPYRCDHIRARGRATMTNTPNGAFRGFGARRPSSPSRRTWTSSPIDSASIRFACANAMRSGPATQRRRGRRSARTAARSRSCARQDVGRASRSGGARSRDRIVASACHCSSTAPASLAAARSSWPRRPPWP
jgi:hypothetical protein